MEENRILISKLDSARRQLETAIKLFFANGDFVSIHALSYAAYTITHNLCDQTNNPESFTKWMHNNIDKSDHNELSKRLREAGNFFKHADRDPKAILEYIPEQYEVFIVFAIRQYEAITHEKTLPMSVFLVWRGMHSGKDDIKNRISESELKRLAGMGKGKFYDHVSNSLLAVQRRIIR